MSDDLHYLWSRFEAYALSMWRASGVVDNQPGHRLQQLFSIRRLPSFENPVSWSVFEQTAPDGTVARLAVRCEWLKDTDYQQLDSPINLLKAKHRGTIQPQLSRRVLEIPQAAPAPLVEALRDFRVGPPIDEGTFGLDGETFELVLGSFWTGLTLHWWGDGPDAWSAVTSATHTVFAHLEQVATESPRE